MLINRNNFGEKVFIFAYSSKRDTSHQSREGLATGARDLMTAFHLHTGSREREQEVWPAPQSSPPRDKLSPQDFTKGYIMPVPPPQTPPLDGD